MAARLDVSARLSEGREALAHTETYISACRRLGYQHLDLTGYDGQVLDWYDGEDGLDLRLLDDDCAALGLAVNGVEEALRVQRAQLGELATAWRGPGAEAAAAFLQQHCAAGEVLVGGLRATARACETLRDGLWRLVDDKVTTAVSVDDRVGGQRPVWLAAVHAQDTEVIEHQIKAYVDNDIRGDWLTAMRSCRTGVAVAYSDAAMAVGPPSVAFPIPGELGPRWQPDYYAAPVPVAAAVPAVAGPPVDAPSIAPAVAAPAAARPDDPLSDAGLGLGNGWPTDTGVPGDFGLPFGGGMPAGGGGGLSGLIPRLVDALGGLGSPGNDGFTDPGVDAPFGGEPADEVAADEDSGADDEAATVDDAELESEEPAAEVADDAPADDATGPAEDQIVAPPDEPAAPEPTDSPEKTPCEIAADELPQAGE